MPVNQIASARNGGRSPERSETSPREAGLSRRRSRDSSGGLLLNLAHWHALNLRMPPAGLRNRHD